MSSEQFVNVSYRGMEVGTSLKMIEFGPTTAYVELTTPMPVGTTLDMATEAGVAFTATVVRIQEQVAGAEMSPGMRVRARDLEGDAAAWWKAAVSEADPVIPEPRRDVADLSAPAEPAAEPQAAAAEPAAAEPEPEPEPAAAAEPAPDDEPEERQPKRTQVMDVSEIQAAIAAGGDVAELAAEMSDGVPGGVDAQLTDKNPSGSNGDPRQPAPEPEPDDKKKRKRRRKRK